MYPDDRISGLNVSAYTVPTDSPESDGTFEWNSTTLVLTEIRSGDKTGVGYTYGDTSIATFINKKLKPLLTGHSPYDINKLFDLMSVAVRNEGHCGLAYMAISAVDAALWDLKAKLLNLPVCSLIGQVHDGALIYGSGGFTSYSNDQLEKQLGGWSNSGFTAVKMKIGRQQDKDPERIKVARDAIGKDTQLFIDANGAFTAKQALTLTEQVENFGIYWFEEPVSSDDLDGLAFIRQHVPTRIQIAAGEYGYNLYYFKQMLQQKAVDVLQADATRCGGITGFMRAGYLSEAFHIPFSFHCAPALHLHAAVCLSGFYIGEYFHDHARIEQLFFDGAPQAINGHLNPDLSQPGFGLTFKYQDAEKYKVS
jgi:L-alanine-DL-glutamate epimerase-like enolase superfamily enzyme